MTAVHPRRIEPELGPVPTLDELPPSAAWSLVGLAALSVGLEVLALTALFFDPVLAARLGVASMCSLVLVGMLRRSTRPVIVDDQAVDRTSVGVRESARAA